MRVQESVIRGLPAKLREEQPVFSETGGLHATGLFAANGSFITLREDVGRHNALDKVVGRHLMAGDLPLSQSLALVSGRASWELMQKAAAAGIPNPHHPRHKTPRLTSHISKGGGKRWKRNW